MFLGMLLEIFISNYFSKLKVEFDEIEILLCKGKFLVSVMFKEKI